MSTVETAAHTQGVSLQINGVKVQAESQLRDTLLTVLRERLHLTAAKRGCNQGVCGACTISVDGQPMRACLSLAMNCETVDIRTLEGMCDSPRMKALQRAFAENGAFQCGFCTPGMLVSAHALIERTSEPDESAIRTALSGNLCRCTGYVKIIAAVQDAAAMLRQEGSEK